MNKQDKIKELTERIESISKELLQLTSEKEGRWIPEEDDKYNYIDSYDLAITKFFKFGSVRNEAVLDGYNVFPPDWDLTDLIEKQKIQRALWECAKRLNGDWTPDWNDEDEKKFHVTCWSMQGGTAISHIWLERSPNEVYFKSEEIAQEALDELTEAGVLK